MLRKAHILVNKNAKEGSYAKQGDAAGNGWAIEELMAPDGLLASKPKKRLDGSSAAELPVSAGTSPKKAYKMMDEK